MNSLKQFSFALSFMALVVISFISHAFEAQIGIINIALIHLIPILIVALHGNMVATFVITTVSVVAFDYMYVPPIFSFTVHEFLYFWSFVIFFVVGYIITKQVQILRQKTDEANSAKVFQKTSELREILLNSVSHDLRTPLSSIIATIHLLQKNNLDTSTTQELLVAMDQNAYKMNRLISGLLDYARLQDSGNVLREDWCDLEDLLGVALAEFEPQKIQEQVHIHIDEDLPLFYGDGVLLVQLFINLLDNAFKYCQDSAMIKISITHKNNKEICIEFFNTSKYIADTELEHIFDRFYRLQEHGDIKGSGIGLFICKSIVLAHEGNVRAFNSDGGVIFLICLPVRKTPQSINKEIE